MASAGALTANVEVIADRTSQHLPPGFRRLSDLLQAGIPQELPPVPTANFFVLPLACLAVAAVLAVRRPAERRPVAAFGVCILILALGFSLPVLSQIPAAVSQVEVGATGDLLQPATAAAVFPIELPAWSRYWHDAVGTFSRSTLDVAMTMAIALAAFRKKMQPRQLLFLLAFSTTIGLVYIVRPQASWWYFLAFVVPVVHQYIVAAGPLNRKDDGHAIRVPATVGSVLLVLSIAGYLHLLGAISWPKQLSDEVLGCGRGINGDFLLLAIAWYVATQRLSGESPDLGHGKDRRPDQVEGFESCSAGVHTASR